MKTTDMKSPDEKLTKWSFARIIPYDKWQILITDEWNEDEDNPEYYIRQEIRGKHGGVIDENSLRFSDYEKCRKKFRTYGEKDALNFINNSFAFLV